MCAVALRHPDEGVRRGRRRRRGWVGCCRRPAHLYRRAGDGLRSVGPPREHRRRSRPKRRTNDCEDSALAPHLDSAPARDWRGVLYGKGALLGVVAQSSPGGTIDIRFMPVAFRHRVNKELLSKMRVSALEGRSVQTNPALPPSGSRPDRDPTRHSIWQVLLLFAALSQGCPSRTPRRLRRDQARRCFHFRPR